jgi:hypothetical protein
MVRTRLLPGFDTDNETSIFRTETLNSATCREDVAPAIRNRHNLPRQHESM